MCGYFLGTSAVSEVVSGTAAGWTGREMIFSTRFECSFTSSSLVSSVVSHLIHSFRVQFRYEYHRGQGYSPRTTVGLETCKTTLQTSEEDVKTKLETSEDDEKLHSKRVEKMKNYTRNEWGRQADINSGVQSVTAAEQDGLNAMRQGLIDKNIEG